MTRAERNNNPLNIRKGERWQGLAERHEMTPAQKAEKEFCVFRAVEWGIRAAVRILQTYRTKYGIATIEGIITRWAPSKDGNNTEAYIARVCESTHWLRDQVLDTADPAVLRRLLKAMITVEAGRQFCSDRQIEAGIALADLPAPELKPMSRSKEQAIAVAGGAAAATMAFWNQARDLLPGLEDWIGADRLPWVILALFAAVFLNRWRDRLMGKR